MIRTRLARLVRYAPFVIMALMLAVWLLTPASIRGVSFDYAAQREILMSASIPGWELPDPEVIALERLGASAPDVSGGSGEGEDPFSRALRLAADATDSLDPGVLDAEAPLFAGALAEDAAAFEALREYEDATGAETLAILMPVAAEPPLALSSVADPTLLSEAESLGEPEALAALRESASGSVPGGPGVISFDELGSSRGWEWEDRSITYGLRMLGGRFYEVWGITRAPAGGYMDLALPQTAGPVDQPSTRRAFDRMASAVNGAVLVLGPLDGEPVVVRTSSDRLAPMAQALVDLVATIGEGYLGPGAEMQPVRLSADLARETGGEWVSAGFARARQLDGHTGPSPLLWVIAVHDRSPQAITLWEDYGRTPTHVLRVWMGTNLLTILAALGVLLLASLVASPVAWLHEARVRADRELETERERLKREAESRVFERLAQLSTEVERVAESASGSAAREAGQVAQDIDATVAALRQLLEGSARGDRDA